MDSQVERDGDPRDRRGANELGVAEQSSRAVVVAVEEGEGLLLEEQEDGIQQFEVLGEVVQLFDKKHVSNTYSREASLAQKREAQDGTQLGAKNNEGQTYVVEDNQGLGPAAIVVADGVEDAAASNGGHKLLNEEDEKDTADGSQVEVVDEEQRLELEGLAVAHVLAAAKDDGVVDDNEDGGRLEGRHGGLERHKLELVGRVAGDGSPGLVEDGPQVDAKGAIDRRHGDLFEKRGHFERRGGF